MRVLISGGGIADLTQAFWLHHYDIPAVVIEQAKEIHREGHRIDFLGTCYDMACHMGLIVKSFLSSQDVRPVQQEGSPDSLPRR
jgi:2-polyprenyl-6-methoxyphenol hydroxylase-like FAD-dependent oxidoreductase